MRNLDSVLLEISDPTDVLSGVARRAEKEARLILTGVLGILVVLAISAGLVYGWTALRGWGAIAGYPDVMTVPVIGLVLGALWTTSLRLIIEPAEVSPITLALLAILALVTSWTVRAYFAGLTFGGFFSDIGWVAGARAVEFSLDPIWGATVVVAESLAIVGASLGLTHWYLGPQQARR